MPNPSLIDPKDVQIVFCDMQKEIVARSKTTEPQALSQSAAVLAQLGALFELPMIVSVVPEDDKPPELVHEVAKEIGGLKAYLRATASPFLDPATTAAIAASGRRTLVLAGFATEVVVLHAATAAIDACYRAVLAVDACGGMSERTEAAALRQIEAYGGETSSVVTLATAMAPDFTTEVGRKMFQILQQLRLA